MPNWTGTTALQAGLGASYRLAQNARYRYTDFRALPVYTDLIGGTAPPTDARAGGILLVGDVAFQVRLEQDIAASPVFNINATGLRIDLDDADNDGIELNLGRLVPNAAGGAAESTVWTRSPGAFVVGTDEAFVRVKLAIGDVSDADQIAVGFSVGDYPAAGTLETYTDFFALNVDAGDVKIETRLNSGTAAATDTTSNVADAGTVTLEVRITDSGYARAFIDGVSPSTDVTNFVFDDGDVVHAFFTILNAAAGDPTVDLIEWESGLMSSRGLASIEDTDS